MSWLRSHSPRSQLVLFAAAFSILPLAWLIFAFPATTQIATNFAILTVGPTLILLGAVTWNFSHAATSLFLWLGAVHAFLTATFALLYGLIFLFPLLIAAMMYFIAVQVIGLRRGYLLEFGVNQSVELKNGN